MFVHLKLIYANIRTLQDNTHTAHSTAQRSTRQDADEDEVAAQAERARGRGSVRGRSRAKTDGD